MLADARPTLAMSRDLHYHGSLKHHLGSCSITRKSNFVPVFRKESKFISKVLNDSGSRLLEHEADGAKTAANPPADPCANLCLHKSKLRLPSRIVSSVIANLAALSY